MTLANVFTFKVVLTIYRTEDA